jgi:hypothetical protein
MEDHSGNPHELLADMTRPIDNRPQVANLPDVCRSFERRSRRRLRGERKYLVGVDHRLER